MPKLDLVANFKHYLHVDQHASLIAFSKHIVHQMSFKPLKMDAIVTSALQDMPTEIEVPKPVLLFGKHISIQNSLDKWESVCNPTNFDFEVSMKAI